MSPRPGTTPRQQRVGALVAGLLGLVFAIVGGRLLALDLILDAPATATATVIESGSTTSGRGGRVSYIRYGFTDPGGVRRTGTSTGYSGVVGEEILVEYAAAWPAVHRVSGEGAQTTPAIRWGVFLAGLAFVLIAAHWGWSLRAAAKRGGV